MIFELTEKQMSQFANEACKKGEYGKALKFYRRLHHEHPDSWVYANLVGYCLVYLEKYEEARPYFHQALELDGLEETLMNNIAWSYFEEDKDEKAYEILLPYVDKYPNDLAMQYNMGNSLHSLGKYEDAIFYFKRVRELDSHFNKVYFSLGIAYFCLDEYEKAVPYFLQYKEKEQKEDALYCLSKSYLVLEEYEKHIEVAKELLAIDEDDEEILDDLEFSYMELRDKE